MLTRHAAALCLVLASGFAEASSAQTPADTLVVGQSAEPLTLDPQQATATSEFGVLVNLFEGLVRFRPGTMEIEPGLAREWTVSPDGLTYRFALKDGVLFHDGTPLDAAAVVFTFERMLDADHPFHSTGPFPLAYLFAEVESVTAPDPESVEFKLRRRFAPFLSNLAMPTGAIVSPAAVRAEGPDFARRPVGTGPFAFKAWEPNTGVTLKASKTPGEGAPRLAEIDFEPIADAAERQAALAAGRIDVAMEADPIAIGSLGQRGEAEPNPREALAGDVAQTRLKPGAAIGTAQATGPHLWFLILNTREGPFSDKRVRQAVNYAIDKRRIVEDILHGGGEIAAGPISPAFGSAEAAQIAPYPHDAAKARELIRAAGAEGTRLTLIAPTGGAGMLRPVAMAEAIRADLAEVGLAVTIETSDWNGFLSSVNPGLGRKADMAEMAWTTSDPDTLPFLALRGAAMPSAGGLNAGYYANPQVDDLIEKARGTEDPAERKRVYGQIQAIVHDDAPYAFIAHARQTVAFRSAISGLTLDPTFTIDFRNASKQPEPATPPATPVDALPIDSGR